LLKAKKAKFHYTILFANRS